MEIGDYIRYKEDGIQKIGRIEKISATLDDDVLIIEVDNGDVITSDDVLKSDKSIIHEIEVGDYVNGEKIIALRKDIDERNIHFNSKDNLIFTDYNISENWYYGIDTDKIKSIVTKQQFESMQYVVRKD